MAKNLPQIVEDRILRNDRKGRHIKTDNAQPITYARSIENTPNNRPIDLIWNLRYFQKSLYGTTGVNSGDVSFSLDTDGYSLTVAFVNNTGSGVYDNTVFTWTDSGKTWAVDQWAGYYLKVGDDHYRITSNTATTLALPLKRGSLIVDGTYEIVAFVTNMLIGSYLNPDTSINQRFKILSNSEFEIRVEGVTLFVSSVTTGDAGAPFDTFRDSSLTDYEDGDFVNNSIFFNNGVRGKRAITTFTAATGEIIVGSGFTNAISIADDYAMVKDMLYASGSAEWRTEKYYPLSSEDFENEPNENIQYVRLPSNNGKIFDNNLKAGYAALYSVEFASNIQRVVKSPIDVLDSSLRIEVTDLASGSVFSVLDTGFQPVKPNTSINFVLRSGVFYRIDIYMYAETGASTQEFARPRTFVFDPISKFIDTWRDARATAPDWVSVTGADSSNVEEPGTMQTSGITLSWENSVFISAGSKTEIWSSDAVDGTFLLLNTLSNNEEKYTDTLASGSDRYYKIRHISANGDFGPFTTIRRGIVSAGSAGNAVIDFQWVDNADNEVFPNDEGWFNEAILKAKISVTSELTIDEILFTQPGVAEADLGSTSPATSDAIVDETSGDFVYYKITFTNGEETLRRSLSFRYNKTAPTDPVPADISTSINNLAVLATLEATYSLPLDFQGLEWTWNTVDATPPAVSAKPRAETREKVSIDLEEADFANSTLYIWVRVLDEADNKSDWIGQTADLSNMSISGSVEVIDIMELAFDDGL